ncbi:hypothetical protein HRR83_000753 [Exophiala dermatitidis]|uniref:Uncharacterized protein n=2 Tax=Exophiala dermatitidis TaxID=5970 RepID=H6CB51_EXODN|nr:uncharacterized protein HMPREF1120_08938 [Exophiala dermatitidis NIH/UT8656]KAJ4525090.1 hypothetical protein HRR75_000681 [Exophiala dermatitidis]EHY60998.1 hypothetical protein HMPREF1120_08938 [Exophiala dermatitidis NIH/UT8656]KAJ4528002.1 hypothetical protein HRR74_000757 [Exophiala dermatitidis]KAJ4528635.1 hypothetical protein HRR73_001258 [Exophiala dermatitidis]KAJ4530012.1 hypothetical protein HRR76_009254 [Exophiala dermatitidis]
MTPDDAWFPESDPPSPRCVDGYFPPQPEPQMAVDNETLLRLIEQLEADRKAYLATFEKVHDTLTQALQPQSHVRPGSVPTITTLPLVSSPNASHLHAPAQWPSPKIAPSTSSRRTATSNYVLEQVHHLNPHVPKESILTGEGSSDSEDDESFFAQETLPPREFTEADLIEHLKTHPWDIYSKYILQDLLRNISLLSNGIFLKDRHHQTDANHQHADIYHVGSDGAPLRFSRGDSDEGPLTTWEALKSTNCDGNRKQAVGRIIVVREPPSSLFAALHLTMQEYFDMDSIYRMLIDDYTQTKAITKGYLEKDDRRQRSIVFVFKYHTVIGEGRSPLPWQNHDDDLEPQEGHIPLSSCSSVVALSLAGRPSHTLRRNSRKRKSIVGHIYDPFSPWHVLSIQCFPDWNSSVDVHEHNHHYVNGPDAFLATLLAEYRDAVKRFKEVHSSLQLLATPPNKSIFDSALRDELLFENDQYTYSRRYFWASQTLGLMSNEIKAMIAAYKETFTDEVWSGEHKTLFPGTRDQSSRYSNWRRKLQHTRRQFEKEIAQLEDVLRTFQQQQKEIRGLREWLFSGTSVLESREAVSMAKITVDQGYNIRILTLVTLFFLPLTFVTSIFGMTNMPPEDSFVPFAATTVGICVPTYLLILGVNNREWLQAMLTGLGLMFTKLTSRAAPKKSEKLKEKILERRLPHPTERRPIIQKAATYASLEGRLSYDLSAETSVRGSQGFLQDTTRRMSQTISNHLPGAARRASQAAMQEDMSAKLPTYSEDGGQPGRPRQRSSTIKFEEPLYSPTRWRTAESEQDPRTRSTTWQTEASNGMMQRDMDKSTANPSPISPGTTPPISAASNGAPPVWAGGPGPGLTVRADPRDGRGRSVSPGDTGGVSFLRRFTERFPQLQLQSSARTSSSGSLGPEESV